MAFDAYLDLKDIPGEATAKGFEKKIEIFSFSLGRQRPGNGRPRHYRHVGVARMRSLRSTS